MSYFFSQLGKSFGVFFRTIRAFVSRKLMGITSGFRRLTNFSRHATKAAATTVQDIAASAQKPSSRSDYVETGRLLISKALIIRIVLILVALGLIFYFIVWPFILSRFLTAKFYAGDSRIAEWSGRVIVYSDEKKTIPLYSGRLEEGVLQGECKFYDAKGLLCYEGQVRDGERTGIGRGYEDGVLVYEGQFTAGQYDGYGVRYEEGEISYSGQFENGDRSGNGKAYRSGELIYEGQFLDDLYEGRGMMYLDGVLVYDGFFHAGKAEGTGTAYYPSGKISYQGQFLAGEPEGSGVAYREDGSKLYDGGFAEGKYNGVGVLYFPDGGQLEASFLAGEAAGNVIWKKNGFLYYQGEWARGGPNGFGTLYNKAGKVIYEGPFLGGTIDGSSLLGYTTEELRTVLGEGSLRNETQTKGFVLIAEELGLTALCTFQNEKEESKVCQLFLYMPEKNAWTALMPGMAHTEVMQWPEDAAAERLLAEYSVQPGVPVSAGLYEAEQAETDRFRISVLYEDSTRSQALLLFWERTDLAPSVINPGGKPQSTKVEKLIDALDKMISAEGTARSNGAVFGGTNPDFAFSGASKTEDAVALADAMIDYWLETQRLTALEELSDRNDVLLADAQDAAAKGLGTPDQVDELKDRQKELATKINMAKTAIKRAEVQASTFGVTKPGEFALEDMLISFDPGEQSIDDLVLYATSYALAIGSEEDDTAIENRVKESLLNLSDAHSVSKLAQTRYQSLSEAYAAALADFSMGVSTKNVWYEAMDAKTLARVELCAALAEFSKQANHFNQLTGGWVSRTFKWHREVFEPLLRDAILPEVPPEEPTEPTELPTEPTEQPTEPTEPTDQTDPIGSSGGNEDPPTDPSQDSGGE